MCTRLVSCSEFVLYCGVLGNHGIATGILSRHRTATFVFRRLLKFWSLMFSRRKVFNILKSETGINFFLCLAISQK